VSQIHASDGDLVDLATGYGWRDGNYGPVLEMIGPTPGLIILRDPDPARSVTVTDDQMIVLGDDIWLMINMLPTWASGSAPCARRVSSKPHVRLRARCNPS
jgi:hypothetical protein